MFKSVDPTLHIKDILAGLGFSADTISWLSTLIMVFLVGLVAWIAFIIARAIILRIVTVWVKRSKSEYDDMFLETKVFHRLSWIVPGVVIYFLASWALKGNVHWLVFAHKCSLLYIVIIAILSLVAFVEAWHRIYLMLPISEGRSIKGYIQFIKAVIVITGCLVMLSILFRIDIKSIIAGLGAFTAVLVFIFRDTLLGFVASVNLSSNNLLRLGDWITIPGRNIDGTVIDMSLQTVKVENFDKTILTVPTYALVSESFQNWKGMEDSGVRRIKRDFRIDVRSISLLDAETIGKIRKMPLMEPYLEENEPLVEAIMNGDDTTLTNLGAFRAYLKEYLLRHEYIDEELPVMVRDLAPGENGMPVEIYCFSKVNQWVPYETIQSLIFDYVFAIVGKFGLRIFQNPTGSDFENLKK